jgi:hypothetical protein
MKQGISVRLGRYEDHRIIISILVLYMEFMEKELK